MKMLYRQAGENVNKLLSKVKTPDDGYKALGFAIVVEAAEDYRKAKKTNDIYAMRSVERFFKSGLFDILSGGSEGEYIIRCLKEERSEK